LPNLTRLKIAIVKKEAGGRFLEGEKTEDL